MQNVTTSTELDDASRERLMQSVRLRVMIEEFGGFDAFPNSCASLLGTMGLFEGLSNDTYNNVLMLITRIDYERNRLVVQHGTQVVQGVTLPHFVSLPCSKVVKLYVDTKMDTYTVLKAPNLLPQLAAAGLDWMRLSCVEYCEQPALQHNYDGDWLCRVIKSLPDHAPCYGYYVYSGAQSAQPLVGEPAMLLKDSSGNYIDLAPPQSRMVEPTSQRIFIEDPAYTMLNGDAFCYFRPAIFKVNCIVHPVCFPFSTLTSSMKGVHGLLVRDYHDMISQHNEDFPDQTLTIIDGRTVAAFYSSAHVIERVAMLDLSDGVPDTRVGTQCFPSDETFAIARSMRKCDCCSIHTHLDIIACTMCGAAAYCSKLCLKLHARQHKKVCKSAEWKAQQRAAALARKEQLDLYEKRVREEDKARKDAEAARRKQVETDRLRRAAQPERPYAARGLTHRGKDPIVKTSPTAEERAKRAVAKEESQERQRQHEATLLEKEKQRVAEAAEALRLIRLGEAIGKGEK